MFANICVLTVVVCSALAAPAPEQRDIWSKWKHKIEHVAHDVGHAAETAAAMTLGTSLVGTLAGKRDISEEKRGFWSHIKHKAEHVAHNVGHAAEAAAGVALANSAVGMLAGRREISEVKRDFWNDLKDKIEQTAHDVGNAVETAAATLLDKAATMVTTRDTAPEFWSHYKDEVEVVAHTIGQAAENAFLTSMGTETGPEERRALEMTGMADEFQHLKLKFVEWWNTLFYLGQHQAELAQTMSTGTQTDE